MSWLLIQSVAVLLVPVILPRAFRFVRSLRNPSNKVHTPSLLQALSISLLLFVAVTAVVATFPWFYPENVIKLTNGRLLQTPNEVLARRLEKLRFKHGSNLTAEDTTLLGRLGTKEGRLIYASFGPEPLIKCLWCREEDPSSFFIYSLPGIVMVHLAHTAILGMVTSKLLSKEGGTWRTHATVAGLTLAIAEVVALWSHDIYSNTRTDDAGKIVWFHWDLKLYRRIGIALVDTIFSALLHLSATHRISSPVRDEERIEDALKVSDSTLSVIRAGVFLKCATMEDQLLRDTITTFWQGKGTKKSQILSDDQTKEAMKNQSARVNVEQIINEAEMFTDRLMQNISQTAHRTG